MFDPNGYVGEEVEEEADQVMSYPHARGAGFGEEETFEESSGALNEHQDRCQEREVLVLGRDVSAIMKNAKAQN